MASSMATKKLTITLEDDQLAAIQKLVAGGKAASVSGFVKQVGVLLAASRTADIADAHVVICARRHGEPIVTSAPAI